MRLTKTTLALAAAFLLIGSAQAADECPMLPQADVIKAFDQPDARLDTVDVSGACSWSLAKGGTLVASVQKRPKASDAKILYDSYKSTVFANLTRGATSPGVGQHSTFGMSAEGAQRGEASFISLSDDSLFVLNYYARGDLDEKIAAPILALGRIGASRKDKADQSFGKCEWFTQTEIDNMLGKGKQTIQRMGPNHCIASVIPSLAVLTAMTDRVATERSLGHIMERSEKSCTVTPMPHLGTNAHATSECGEPAWVRVQFIKNGTHVMFTWTPATRDATEADITTLDVIARRAFDRL